MSCGISRSPDILLIIEILSAIPLAAMMSCDIVAMVASISQAYTLEAPDLTANMLENRKKEKKRKRRRRFSIGHIPLKLCHLDVASGNKISVNNMWYDTTTK